MGETAATAVTFELTRALNVLDLTELPPIPSAFGDGYREPIQFLHEFVRELTQPVQKDGREHVEYVPSQVVTEYVRYRLPIKIGRPIEGLTYDSARRVGGKGVVLFFAHEGINSDDAFGPLVTFPLRIVDELTVTVPVAE